MNSKVTPLEGGFVCTRSTGRTQTALSSLASETEELWSDEQFALSCFNSVAKNLRNIKFWRVKTFKEPANFQWNPSLLSEPECWKTWDWSCTVFPPQPHVCCGWERALWSKAILSSPPTAASLQKPLSPNRQPWVTTASEEAHRGGRGWRVLWTAAETLVADPQEIETQIS